MSKGAQKRTTVKWLACLNEIKKDINNNNHSTFHKFIAKHKISTTWGTFLISNNVIYKENNFYRWNEKIPVSIKLIEKFREFCQRRDNNYKETNLFNMPSSVTPPRPKVTKTRIDSKYLSVNDIVEIYGKSESTIRRIIDDAKQNGVVKEVPMKNGVKKIYISKDYLDSIFKTKVKVRFYDKPNNELGVIRRFLKWLW